MRGRTRPVTAPRLRVARAGVPEVSLGPCPTGLPRLGEPITEQHLERALEIMAEIVVRRGEVVAPLYTRIEAELEALRQRRSPLDRARALLAAKASRAV